MPSNIKKLAISGRKPDDSNIKHFISFLKSNGVEKIPTTSEFEVFRYRCRHAVGVIYHGKRGYSFNNKHAQAAYDAFKDGQKWYGRPFDKRQRRKGQVKRDQILSRDGNSCFFCSKEFDPSELTAEHLLCLAQGGVDTLNNMVLACEPCNQLAGSKSLPDKILLRDKIRNNYEQ